VISITYRSIIGEIGVIAHDTTHRLVASTTDEAVIPSTAVDGVIASTGVERIVAGAAVEQVIAGPAVEHIRLHPDPRSSRRYAVPVSVLLAPVPMMCRQRDALKVSVVPLSSVNVTTTRRIANTPACTGV
jgi:hypothetical protein